MQTALLVSWAFPPIGGSGVQRNLKLAKYLPQHGWRLAVLAVGEVAFLPHDPSLLDELGPETIVRRTASADLFYAGRKLLDLRRTGTETAGSAERAAASRPDEKGVLARVYRTLRDTTQIPDDRIGWYPFAVPAGRRLAREVGADVVIGSMPSATNAIVARRIACAENIPYLIDFRDGWLDDPYKEYPTALHESIHARLERRVVGQADGIVCYGEALREPLVDRYPRLAERSTVITNGYDPDDIPERSPSGTERSSFFEVVYVGSVYTHHEGNVRTLVEALSSLPVLVQNQIRVRFVGSVYEGARALVEGAGLGDMVSFEGYMPHAEALQRLVDSDASLLFVRAGDTTSMTGKVFEYVGAQVPIVALVEPSGACAEVLRSAGHEEAIIQPQDVAGLRSRLTALASGEVPPVLTSRFASLSRPAQAQAFADVLDRTAEGVPLR